MLWKTHIRITLGVARRLGIPLSNIEAERLKEGVLAPDKWKDDYPHHYGKSEKISQYLLSSRQYFLNDDLLNAYYHLGIALHYIQDSYTSYASFYPKHHQWEESIDSCELVGNVEEMIGCVLRNNGFERDRCLRLARALSNETSGRDTLRVATLTGYEASKSFAKPIVDLNLGFRASYIISKSVLGPKMNSDLNNQIANNLAVHQILLNEAEDLLATQITELEQQREKLLKKKVTSQGIVNKLKNVFLFVRIKTKELQLNSKYQVYFQKKHFQKVAKKYKETTDEILARYVGWYNYSVPALDFTAVKRQLVARSL